MASFVRGGFAEQKALKARGIDYMDPVPPPKAALPVSAASGLDGGRGAVTFSFVSRRKITPAEVLVSLDDRLWEFPTLQARIAPARAGVVPIRVPQYRIGPNVGAIEIVAGHVTSIVYRFNLWGPPGGKFIRGTARLWTVEEFLAAAAVVGADRSTGLHE
jgi:hypothetical protein